MDLRATAHDYRVVQVNLAVNLPFEQWNVLDVFNLQEEAVEVSVDLQTDLHLDLAEGPYLVYDYWNRQFVGEVARSFSAALRPHASRIYAVRRKTGLPQVLSHLAPPPGRSRAW